jgi:hypothetical protein
VTTTGGGINLRAHIKIAAKEDLQMTKFEITVTDRQTPSDRSTAEALSCVVDAGDAARPGALSCLAEAEAGALTCQVEAEAGALTCQVEAEAGALSCGPDAPTSADAALSGGPGLTATAEETGDAPSRKRPELSPLSDA